MGETKEPKIARKAVLIALGIICIVLAAYSGGVVAVANLQEQSGPNTTYTVVGTLGYANVSAVYSGVIVESINPSFAPNLVGSFMFLTFNGQLSWTFPAGFVSGNVVVINGTISFDEHSQTYFLNVVSARLPGDINGDGKVNLTDLVIFAKAYGSKPGDPNWNPAADILGHGEVDLADLVLLAEHYGQHYP